jgi:hypothetical protein
MSRVDSTSSDATGSHASRSQIALALLSTSVPDKLRHTSRSDTQNCFKTVVTAWNGRKRSVWVSTFHPVQVAYPYHSVKLVESFKIWWTRRDSNPRPPRCERGKNYPKTRFHNHLAFSMTSSNSLSKPGLQHSRDTKMTRKAASRGARSYSLEFICCP